jgi:thiosulfate/3-mercaptopyruvate sulfurtransferase
VVFSTLVSTGDLADHLDDANWVICDCRHDLLDLNAGRAAYAKAHIPGAHFLHIDDDLSGPKLGQNGRHPLPQVDKLTARLAEVGIDQDCQVIAYDAHGGMFAARLWWLLRWLGHEAVAVLDGGVPKWIAEGRPITADLVQPRSKNFERSPGVLPVDATFVLTHLDGHGMRLVDARAADRFAGQNETLDPVAGHIPGALNRFFKLNLNERGCFKPADLLREEFTALLDKTSTREVVHYCGSGVTACHNLLAMEHAGLAGSRLYPGSWSEWCADPGRPMVRRAIPKLDS